MDQQTATGKKLTKHLWEQNDEQIPDRKATHTYGSHNIQMDVYHIIIYIYNNKIITCFTRRKKHDENKNQEEHWQIEHGGILWFYFVQCVYVFSCIFCFNVVFEFSTLIEHAQCWAKQKQGQTRLCLFLFLPLV